MQYYTRLSFLALLLICATFGAAKTTQAETALFFSPTRSDLSEKNTVQEIRVTNMSDITRSYNITVQNIIMNTNGQTTQVDNFDYSAKRMIRFVPRQFNIAPGEKQIIRLMARFPDGTEDGAYHAHLEFLENIQKREELNKELSPENRARANAQIAYATAIPVVITKGEIKTEIGMKNIEISAGQSGKPKVSMVLTRSGNGQGNAYIEADHVMPDGTENKAAVRRSIYIYRELSERQHGFNLELIDQTALSKGGQIKLKLYNRDISETEPVETILIPVK